MGGIGDFCKNFNIILFIKFIIMKIKIGADELILWLRKNNIANDLPNDEIHGLGVKIRRVIEDLDGQLVAESEPCFWANADGDKNIGQFALPKTAAQYEIDVERMQQLYEQLKKW